MEETAINAFQVVGRVTPLFWIVLGLALAIGAGELALLIIARRRRSAAGEGAATDRERRLAARLAVAAAAGPVLLAATIIASIEIGHARLLAGLAADDPRLNVALIVAGLEGFLNAKSWGLLLLGPVLVLATIAAALHAAAATRSPARPIVLTLALFVLAGLGSFLGGAFLYSARLIKLLAGVAGIDPELKRIMIIKGLEETRVALDGGAISGAVGFGAALVAGISIAAAQRKRGGVRDGSWWPPALCLLAAIALWGAARPLRAENTTPWPTSPGAALTINRVATPAIDGPDVLPPAEVVTVGNDLLLGDGSPRNLVELHDALVILRNNYTLLHPGEPPDENLVIVCAPDTRTEALVEVLQLAKTTEYRRPAFAFGKETTIERPMMGKQRRWKWTAVKALIRGAGPETPTPVVTVTVGDYPTCDGVARAVVAVRRAGNIARLAF
jgi:hypothetical protein